MTEHVEGTLPSGQYWQGWLLESGTPKGVVLIVHGIHEHGGRYHHVAERFAEAGYVSYAVDHPGHGASPGTRANIGSMAKTVEGVHLLAKLAAERHPGLPLFVFGHSLGGLISLQYVTGSPADLRGLVVSAAALDTSAATKIEKLLAPIIAKLLPNLRVTKISLDTLSRDPEVARAYRNDPLCDLGRVRARTGNEILATVGAMPDRLKALKLPVFAYHGTEDRLVSKAGTEVVERHAGSPDLTIKYYDGLYHESHNEPEKDQVLGDIVAWLDAHA